MGRRRLELTGRRFGTLAVLSPAGSDGQHSLWNARCDCGAFVVRLGKDLTKNSRRFCGHTCKLFKAAIAAGRRTHGMSKHPAFAVWRSMLDRCRLPTHQAWKNYGGRGIKVCPDWAESFENFWRDMGPSYYSGLTIERKNNDKGYSRTNCKWATHKEQNNNRRDNITISTPKGLMTVAQASRAFGIGVTTILYRISREWPNSRLFDAPGFHNRIA